MTVTVTIEVGSQATGWRFGNEATCEPDAAVFTARTLWDETPTEVQGRSRRLTYSATSHGITERRSTEVRP
jgi:hypothetical protein